MGVVVVVLMSHGYACCARRVCPHHPAENASAKPLEGDFKLHVPRLAAPRARARVRASPVATAVAPA